MRQSFNDLIHCNMSIQIKNSFIKNNSNIPKIFMQFSKYIK